jgi:hypothetical protein
VAAVESDRSIGTAGEQLQHAASPGADVEDAPERQIADSVEDRCFDGVGCSVQRTFLVPDRRDLFEVLVGGSCPTLSVA